MTNNTSPRRLGGLEAVMLLEAIRQQVRTAACERKTSRGNVYDTIEEAHGHAAVMACRTGNPIVAFRCNVCGKHHVGKIRKRD